MDVGRSWSHSVLRFSPSLPPLCPFPSPPHHRGALRAADEVPAVAAKVPGVPGGRQGAGGPAGAPRRAHTAKVQHGPHPRPQRVRHHVQHLLQLLPFLSRIHSYGSRGWHSKSTSSFPIRQHLEQWFPTLHLILSSKPSANRLVCKRM